MTVALPAMSKLQHDAGRYISYYKKYVFLLAFFSMPMVACLAIFSNELVLIVLGKHWLESSKIFLVLALAGFIQPVSSSSGLVMISTGQTKKFFIIGCITSAIIVLGFLIGIHWGVIGTAVSLVVTTYLLLIPTLHFSFRNTPVRVSIFFNEIAFPVLHTILMCLLLMVAKLALKNMLPNILIFIFVAPLGMIFYYFSWKIYPAGRDKLSTIDELAFVLFQKIRKKKPAQPANAMEHLTS